MITKKFLQCLVLQNNKITFPQSNICQIFRVIISKLGQDYKANHNNFNLSNMDFYTIIFNLEMTAFQITFNNYNGIKNLQYKN